jgi:hypothetical protein
MQRLEMTPEYMGVPIFYLEDVVRLLTHARKETFNGERAVRLFQFQTWILYPDKPQYLKWAGLSAAAKLLDRMEENHFVDEDDARLGLLANPSCLDGGGQGAQIGRGRRIGEVVFLLT